MFLDNEQTDQLKNEPLEFISNQVMPDIVTPISERDDIEEFKEMMVDEGVLLLPDNDEAISLIMDIVSEYADVALRICRRKRPS